MENVHEDPFVDLSGDSDLNGFDGGDSEMKGFGSENNDDAENNDANCDDS